MTTTPPQDSERERFESLVAEKYRLTNEGHFEMWDGHYVHQWISRMWEGWQLRAALDTPPAISIHDEGCKCVCLLKGCDEWAPVCSEGFVGPGDDCRRILSDGLACEHLSACHRDPIP